MLSKKERYLGMSLFKNCHFCLKLAQNKTENTVQSYDAENCNGNASSKQF